MGTAYIIIDHEKIDPMYDSEYVMDPEGMVIDEIGNLGATEIRKEKFPDRLVFTYSEEKVVGDIKRYVSYRSFLFFVKEYIRKDKDIH